MKSYAKLVEAIQFKDNITEVVDFMDSPNIIMENDGLPIESFIIVDPITGRWRVQPGDYVVKDFKGLVVYNQARFEAEYQEVNLEDEFIPEIHSTGLIPDIQKFDTLVLNEESVIKETPATPITGKNKKETKKE